MPETDAEEAIIETLRELADGIESGEVDLRRAEFGNNIRERSKPTDIKVSYVSDGKELHLEWEVNR